MTGSDVNPRGRRGGVGVGVDSDKVLGVVGGEGLS